MIIKKKLVVEKTLQLQLITEWKAKKKNEKLNKYLDLSRELRKLLKMSETEIPFVNSAFGTLPRMLENGTRNFENQRENRDNNYSVVMIG